jgi:hypothetical protein
LEVDGEIGPRHLEASGAGNPRRDVLGFFAVVGCVSNERWHSNRAEHVADVDIEHHPQDRRHGTRAGREPVVPGPAGDELRVIGMRRGDRTDRLLCVFVGAPHAQGVLEVLSLLLERLSPRVLRLPGPFGVCVEEDQAERAFRVGGREERAHRGRFDRAEQHRALRSGGVENGAHVVHPSFQRCRLARSVGQTGAAAVEEDEAREGRDPVVKRPLKRCLALDLDVACEAVGKDDVGRPFPIGRIRDREVAALRVPKLVPWIHATQIPRSGKRRL